MTSTELWTQVDDDLYEILHLADGATDDEIQRAWHLSARDTHPDAGGDGSRFRSVHVAYLVLSDPEQRRRYDASRLPAPTPHEPVQDLLPEPDLNTPGEPLDTRLFVGLTLVLMGGVLLSYAWPWFTILIGFAVGGYVMTRYFRHWHRRGSIL